MAEAREDDLRAAMLTGGRDVPPGVAALGGIIGAGDGFGPKRLYDLADRIGLVDAIKDKGNAHVQSVFDKNERMAEHPIRESLRNAMLGIQMGLGARPTPASTALIGRDVFQPRSPNPDIPPYTPSGYMQRAQDNVVSGGPVSGFKDFAEMSPWLDPKAVAARYQRLMPEPGQAASVLERAPAVTPLSPNKDAAALLRRNEAMVDAMLQDGSREATNRLLRDHTRIKAMEEGRLGPWGVRPE